MAENPQVTVAVLADIKGLRAGMQEGERVVVQTTDNMRKAVDSADLGARFAKQAQIATKGLAAITSAFDTLNRAQGDAIALAEGFSQSLMMSGSKMAGVFGAAGQAGLAIGEYIFQTEAKRREELERLAAIEKESMTRAETRDLERQLDILKEADPLRKIELEGARELARIRAKARQEDQTAADRAKTAAEEALSIERTRQRVEEARRKDAAASVSAPEGIIDTLTTSIGGAFRVAQRGAMAMLQQKATDAAQKTADNTRAMLDLMRRGTGAIA